tara:strand:- start:2265 stop:3167 length:903 start_codon:yes stop_codon:yes gene_type:complete
MTSITPPSLPPFFFNHANTIKAVASLGSIPVFETVYALGCRVFSSVYPDMSWKSAFGNFFGRSIFCINDEFIVKETLRLKDASYLTLVKESVLNGVKQQQYLSLTAICLLSVVATQTYLLVLKTAFSVVHTTMNHLNEKGVRGLDREYRQEIQTILEEKTNKLRSFLTHKTERKSYVDGIPKLDICVLYPILEEVFFRLGLQNSINLLQSLFKYSLSNTLLQNKTITWLTSTTARIYVVETLFAGVHFFNEGSFVQPLTILCTCSYSASYESTGSIITPIILHILNNSSLQLLGGLIKTN